MGVTRPFNIRCGINSGICTVGNFGSENRLDYTAIGNQVNLASRLESMAGEGEVLVSEETMLLTQDSFEFKPNKEIYVKGFSRPIKTFSVLNTKQIKQIKKISLHSKGIDLEINPEKINDHSLESLREVLAEIENNI
jgi:class 3 adenylate cyclase